MVENLQAGLAPLLNTVCRMRMQSMQLDCIGDCQENSGSCLRVQPEAEMLW